MRRFWKTAAAGPDGIVRLDGKPVHTPGRRPLALPATALAEAVADEWRAVGEAIDPRAMPLTGLANTAIDRVAPDPQGFARSLAAFGESDLLYYRAERPADLVARQAAAWDPLLDWARARYDVNFDVTTGVMHRPQPAATIARLGDAVAARLAFELAGLSPVVTIGGSLIAALALLEGAAPAETVWRAVELDEVWQAERWGRDDLSLAARDARRADFAAAVRFLELLG